MSACVVYGVSSPVWTGKFVTTALCPARDSVYENTVQHDDVKVGACLDAAGALAVFASTQLHLQSQTGVV